jgi:protein dithiol oxidoreductase (disulfide-forming)
MKLLYSKVNLLSVRDRTKLARRFGRLAAQAISLFSEPSITAWVGKHGVNVAEFTKSYNGFGVATSVGQAEQATMSYRVSGVPTIAIGGRYTVTDDHAKMLATSDELIVKVRAEDKKPMK